MDIKVQHGVAIIPESKKTITVELEKAVNPERAVVLHGGSIYSGTIGNPNYWNTRIVLLDSKHIEVKRAYPSGFLVEVAWQVVEVIPDGEPQEPEKEKEIDWTKVPVDTPVLVRDSEKADWEKRYFAFYAPVSVRRKFAAWYDGNKSTNDVDCRFWEYCKLALEVDPTPYYKD